MIKARYFIWKNCNTLKKWMGYLLLLFVLIVYTMYIYIMFVKPASKETKTNAIIDNAASLSDTVMLDNECVIEQTLIGEQKGISEIKLKLLVEDSVSKGKIKVSFIDLDTNSIIETWNKKVSKLKDKDFISFDLKSELVNIEGKNYSINISGTDIKGGAVYVYISSVDSYGNGFLSISGERQQGDAIINIIPFSVDNTFIIKLFCFLSIMLLSLITIMWFVENSKKHLSIENVFLISMTILSLAYMVVLPAYSVPDEGTHFSTAYELSNKIMGIKQPNDIDELRVIGRDCDVSTDVNYTTSLSTYRYIYNDILNKNDNSMNNHNILLEKSMRRAALISHLPQALGITFARFMKLSYSGLLFLGQFATVITYILLTYFAIHIIPVGKKIIFAISGLPMTLHETTSFSYDAIICGLAFLLIAYIIKMIYEEEIVKIKDIIIIFIISVLLAPCKMVYSFISILLILIPRKKFCKKYIYLFKYIIPIVSIIYAVYFNMGEVSNTTSGVHMIEWANEEGYTVSYLLHHIKKTILLYISTIHEQMGFFVDGMIGGSLGWFNVDVPEELTMCSLVLLLLSIQEKTKYKIKLSAKILFWGIFVWISILIFATMLLGWTPISRDSIVGVQGRYFLPILPLIMIPFVDATDNMDVKSEKMLVIGNSVVNYLVILRILIINIAR